LVLLEPTVNPVGSVLFGPAGTRKVRLRWPILVFPFGCTPSPPQEEMRSAPPEPPATSHGRGCWPAWSMAMISPQLRRGGPCV